MTAFALAILAAAFIGSLMLPPEFWIKVFAVIAAALFMYVIISKLSSYVDWSYPIVLLIGLFIGVILSRKNGKLR